MPDKIVKKNPVFLMKVRNHRDLDSYERVCAPVDDDDETVQSFKEECDIRKIIARYDQTGVIQHVNKTVGEYLDLTGGVHTSVNEYKTAMDLVTSSQQNFERLPAEVREKFNNDPGKFLEFATNPENVESMQEMGLASVTEVPGTGTFMDSDGRIRDSQGRFVGEDKTQPDATRGGDLDGSQASNESEGKS